MDFAASGRQDGGIGVHRHHLRCWGDEAAQKNRLRPWAVKSWCIPKVTTRFVAKMEDVLDVYHRPYDPKRPVVCMDEKAKKLQGHKGGRETLPAVPGEKGKEIERQDYEYKRGGMANLFLVSEPMRGWRRVGVAGDRTAKTFAQQLKQLVDEDYPQAEKVVLVTGNLNTHGPWSLYETFEPVQARRIADKVEWHYTPEHGSWLNMAELELSVLQRQCLKRRIADVETLTKEVLAWAAERNAARTTIDWHFTSADARIKLRKLYPDIT